MPPIPPSLISRFCVGLRGRGLAWCSPRRGLVSGWVWLLLVALPLYGHTSLLLQTLGPAHRHADPARESPLLSAFARGTHAVLAVLRAEAHPRLQAASNRGAQAPERHGHAHHHDHLAHHHHEAGDTSVILQGPVDAAAELSLAVVGSLMLLAPPSASLPLAHRVVRANPWPHDRAAAWSSHTPLPIERPPRAA